MAVTCRHRSSQPLSVVPLSLRPVGVAPFVTVGLLLLLIGQTTVSSAPAHNIVLRGSSSDQMAVDLGDMLAVAANGGTNGAAIYNGGMMPRRPESFRNLEELNQYMAEMRQFYSMLSRPRSVE